MALRLVGLRDHVGGRGEVHEWVAQIQPDEISADAAENYGWGLYAERDGTTPPPGARAVPSGYRPVVLFWD